MANSIVHQLEWSKATRGKYPGSLKSIRDAQGFQKIRYEVYGMVPGLDWNTTVGITDTKTVKLENGAGIDGT